MRAWVIGIALGCTASPALADNVCDAYRDILSRTSDSPSQRTLIGLYATATATGIWAGGGAASHLILKAQASSLSFSLKRSILGTGLADALARNNEFLTYARHVQLGHPRHAGVIEDMANRSASKAVAGNFFRMVEEFYPGQFELGEGLRQLGVSAKARDELLFYLKNISEADRGAIVQAAMKKAGITASTTIGEAMAHESAEAFSKRVFGVLADETAQHAVERAILASPVIKAQAAEMATKLANKVITLEGEQAVVRTVTPAGGRPGTALSRRLVRAAPALAGIAKVAARLDPPVAAWTAGSMIYDMHNEEQIKARTQTSQEILTKYFDKLDADGFCSNTSVTPAEASMIKEIDEQIKDAQNTDVQVAQRASSTREFGGPEKGSGARLNPVMIPPQPTAQDPKPAPAVLVQ